MNLIHQLRTEHGLTFTQLCRASELPYSTFMRWKTRVRRSEPLARRPGPKKLVPVDWNRLEQDILSLRHGNRRSHGTQALYERIKVRGALVVPGHYFFPGMAEEWKHKDECIRVTYSQAPETVKAGLKIIAEESKKAYA